MDKMTDFGKQKTGHANLPQEVYIKEISKNDFLNSDIDDTVSGVDKCIKQGVSQIKKNISHQK